MDSQGQGAIGYVLPRYGFCDARNRGVLRRLSQNDPNIRSLDVDFDEDRIADNPDWAKELGRAISKSTHLRSLMIEVLHHDNDDDDGHGDDDDDDDDGHGDPPPPMELLLLPCFMEIAENRSIEDFRLYGYHHPDMDIFKILAPFFEHNRNLRSISMYHNSQLRERGPSLISALVNMAGLKFIDISHNDLGDSISADLINALRSMAGLHNVLNLHLGGNMIGQQGCAALRRLLRQPACNIQSLHIHHNHLDNVCIDILYGGLVANNSIKFIDIHCQKFVTASGWGVFFDLLFNSICSVEQIDANENDVGDDGVISLGDSLGTSCSIEKLDLSDSRSITNSGWTGFSKGLRSPTCSLLDLDISNCDINDSGALAVAIALTENTSLKVLNISNNSNISSLGWLECFYLMRRNEIRLAELNLSGNNIDDVGVTVLVKILVRMSALVSFRLLDMASVSSVGWREFADVVNPTFSSSKLHVLKLGGGGFPPPQIDDSVIISFAAALIGNSSLTTLSIGGHALSEVGLSSLTDCLCDKSSLVNTFRSNHTLQSMEYDGHMNPDLRSLLVMNDCKNKAEVARKKILATHFVDDGACVLIFAPMPAPTLPTALSWIGRDRREYSMMYNFLHGMSWPLDSTAIFSTE